MFLWNFNQRWGTFKQRYIAGSAKCSTKPLSKLLTCILSAVKTGLQSYCDTIATWGVVWIRCGFFDWQHICYAWWTCFSIDSRHPYGYKLFSSSRWLVPLFIHLYEADFIQGRLKKNEKKIARSFNFTFRYIDNVLSLNKSTFGDFVDHIYPIELEIMDITYTDKSALYLDLLLEIDSLGRLRTKLYDKRDDFNFPIVNFPCICSNIPAAPAYGVYISQLIRDSRACGSYQCH